MRIFFHDVLTEIPKTEPVVGSVKIDFANLHKRGGWAHVHKASDVTLSSFEVGRVGWTQEPGGKLRVYFDPKLFVQGLLQPLQKSLEAVLRKLPWDCTHDQEKAIPWIKERLTSGGKVFSVDLSDATNVFPWGLQHLVLEKIYRNIPIVRFMAAVVTGGYWTDPGGNKWFLTRGQAMGLAPSFALFAATHGLLVEGLLDEAWKGQFFILGDDIVILNDKLADRYLQLLEYLDVPVSPGKTFISNVLAEFAGRLVTKDGVFQPPKYKNWDGRSILDGVKNFPRWVELVPRRDQPLVEQVLSLPEPYGVGCNPLGIPFEDRMTPELQALLDREEQPLEREVSLTSKWQQWMRDYWSPMDPSFSYEIGTQLDLLDQRRREKFTFPTWKLPIQIMGEIEGQIGNPRIPVKTKVKVSRGLKPISFWRRVFGTLYGSPNSKANL
jgi:hypothetical protein